jgi:hypothetical protein
VGLAENDDRHGGRTQLVLEHRVAAVEEHDLHVVALRRQPLGELDELALHPPGLEGPGQQDDPHRGARTNTEQAEPSTRAARVRAARAAR